jgi:pyruvate-formate lyase-activating enzyme
MIPLTTNGRSTGFQQPVVARVARSPEGDRARQNTAVIVTDANPVDWKDLANYRAIITTLPRNEFSKELLATDIPVVHSAMSIDHLKSGDVVTLFPRSGLVRTVFRPDSVHNFLFATQRCNSFCLMCSQPPVDRDDSEQVRINLETIRLIEPPLSHLGITGGEPTLLGDGLLQILEELRARLPETNIHLLTNGRRFARPDFVAAFMAVAHPRLTVCIPVYSDSAPEHDYVVQVRGAFDQTIQGLHRLARLEQAVEIRVVLHKLTIPRLNDLAHFIYRNLPIRQPCRPDGTRNNRIHKAESEQALDRPVRVSNRASTRRRVFGDPRNERVRLQSSALSVATRAVEICEAIHFRLEKCLLRSLCGLWCSPTVRRLFYVRRA